MYAHTFRNGMVAMFDDDVAPLLAGYLISIHTFSRGSRTFNYVRLKQGAKRVMAHRLITGAPDGLVVDHIDSNGLNNQRTNLRICSQSDNSCNRRPNAGRALPKGVWARRNGKFSAAVRRGGKTVTKTFETAEAAEAWRLTIVPAFHGEFARTTETVGG